MTLYTSKSAVWLLLLLWAMHGRAHVGARPLRGTVSYKPHLPQFRRQLKMALETPWPTWNPSLSPSTIEPIASPTIVPTWTGTSTPTLSPTTSPYTDTPTFQPTTVAITPTPTNVPSAVAPTPSQPPPTTLRSTVTPTPSEPPPTTVPATVTPTPSDRTPTVAPPTQAPTTGASPPTDAALFRVPLADFQLQYNGDDGEGIPAVIEQYLADSMQLNFLVGVELTDVPSRRRRLQQSSSTISFLGNAIFNDLPVPSIGDVQAQQTVALEDTDALQQAFSDADLNVTVETVVIKETETSTSSTAADNAGVIAGVFVAAMVLFSLAAFVGYRRWCSSDADKHSVAQHDEHTKDHKKDFVKYTPDDFEPAVTTSQSVDVEEELPGNLDESILDMDEYSLSAVSADSSIKKDPEQRRRSLLQRLALYKKTELQPSPVRKKKNKVPMPATFLVPRAIQPSPTQDEDEPRTPTPTQNAATPTRQNMSTAAATSLLQNDGDNESDEGTEVDLLPPPLSDSSGSSPPRMFQDRQPQQPMIVAPRAKKAHDFNSVLDRLSRQRTPPKAGVVVAKHDFPSTTWQHPPFPAKAAAAKAYSDGPSDELNFELEQDLSNFDLPAVVSPEPPSPPRIIRGRSSPPSPPPPPPPRPKKN